MKILNDFYYVLIIDLFTLQVLFSLSSCTYEEVDNDTNNVASNTDKYFVLEIIDGDTFYILDSTKAKSKTKIRMIGVDAPESKKVFDKEKHPFGDSSKLFLKGLIESKRVDLEYDVDSTDRYGRELCYVYVGESENRMFVNLEMLRQGYAWIMTVQPNVKFVDTLLVSQREARAKRLGIWRSYDSTD